MPEKLNLPPQNYENIEQSASDNLGFEPELLEAATELPIQKSPEQVQTEVDNLTEQARSLAEADNQPESESASKEKYQQAVKELMNQVGESGLQQIELLAHGSERLNGFRAVIETGFNPSQAVIEKEINTIRELVLAKRDLTLEDHKTHEKASAIIKDKDIADVLKLRSPDEYQADLNSLKIAINDETANKDQQLVELIEAIPSQGKPKDITSAMEKAIEAMRDSGNYFADSSTAKLMALLQTMDQETA